MLRVSARRVHGPGCRWGLRLECWAFGHAARLRCAALVVQFFGHVYNIRGLVA